MGLALAVQAGGAAVSPEFAERRARMGKLVADSVFVLFGAKESTDLHDGFYQQTDFYYFTGWEEPGAILIITPEPEKGSPGYERRIQLPREILFLPQRVPGQEKWTGRKLGPDDPDAKTVTGFQSVLPAERFERELRNLLDEYPYLAAITNDPLNKMVPSKTVHDSRAEIASLRMVKSAGEIAAIQKATDASVKAHRAAWNLMKPGTFEYQAAAVMVGTYMEEGCRRSAYAPIVGSGPNSSVLHYSRNSRRMDSGEVVVMDVAAECAGYASDITRTIPVNGKFTARQREIYEIVLGAQRAAIAAIKPGVLIRTGLREVAFNYMNTHGKDLHGEPLGKYFIHGLSHHVGLDVHDSANDSEPLKAGMVITIEPGIYLPEENIGVRIEDTVLVMEDGARVLSSALPTEPGEIERALAQRN